MNILFLCDEYPPCNHGGIGTLTQVLARELVKQGNNVVVCGFYPYFRKALPFEIDLGVEVYRHFYGSKLLLQFSRRRFLGDFFNIDSEFKKYNDFLLRIIEEKKIDIIEIPDFNEAFRYSGPRFIEFSKFNIPVVIKLHGSYNFINSIVWGQLGKKSIYEKEKSLLNSATKLVAISNFTKEKIKEIYRYTKDIEIIYNGLTISDSVKNTDDSKHTVIFAGKICEMKGVFSLILAWEKVLQEIPFAKLLIFGKAEKRDLKKLNLLINDKIKHSIELKGFVNKEKLTEIYSTAACAIFPSYAESFSMAPLESMQVGCPTIYTKRASGPELITNKVNGLIVDPDNIEEIADAIILMLKDRKSATEMGKRGSEAIKEKFNIAKIAEEHVSLYNSII